MDVEKWSEWWAEESGCFENDVPHDTVINLCKIVWRDAISKAIGVVESYQVSVCNSASGELAAEWTIDNLREIRDALLKMIHNAELGNGGNDGQ